MTSLEKGIMINGIKGEFTAYVCSSGGNPDVTHR
jgi:hypothetical protein